MWDIPAAVCLVNAGMMTFTSWLSQACSSTHTVPRRQAGSCCIRHVQGPSMKSIHSSSHSSSQLGCSFCSRIVALCSPSVELWRSRWALHSLLHSPSSWHLARRDRIICKWVLRHGIAFPTWCTFMYLMPRLSALSFTAWITKHLGIIIIII